MQALHRSSLIRIVGKKNRNKHPVELSPFLGKLSGKVLDDAEVGTDKIPFEAFLGVLTLSSEHDAVEVDFFVIPVESFRLIVPATCLA